MKTIKCFSCLLTAYCLHSFVLVIVAIVVSGGLSAAAQRREEVKLGYFRVVDKTAYSKAPGRYERLLHRESRAEPEIYVERQPSHEIATEGIELVTVSKIKKFGNSPEEQKELERILKEVEAKTFVGKGAEEAYLSGFYYRILFKLRRSEWKNFVVFNNNNLRGSFQVRLGRRDIGLLPFLLRLDEKSDDGDLEIGLYTQLDDSNQLKEMLSPLKTKVVWE